MKIYKKGNEAIIYINDIWHIVQVDYWDPFINREGLRDQIIKEISGNDPINYDPIKNVKTLDAPMGNQEVWAAGVTYLKSKEERERESKGGGGSDFYHKVYDAKRPELFFKATSSRTVGSGDYINIRRDSKWNVPEPELTLFISSSGSIEAYTIGNDVSSRSIEGKNPLYLPQAKTYERSAALGPCLYLPESPLSQETMISLEILRFNVSIFEGNTRIKMIKRSFKELVNFLFRECNFPVGCFLMTGTGIVPPESFTLLSGDEVRISIEGIGELVNLVAHKK